VREYTGGLFDLASPPPKDGFQSLCRIRISCPVNSSTYWGHLAIVPPVGKCSSSKQRYSGFTYLSLPIDRSPTPIIIYMAELCVPSLLSGRAQNDSIQYKKRTWNSAPSKFVGVFT